MKQFVAPLGSKGRLTLPPEVRQHLQLQPGDRVFFVLTDESGQLTTIASRLIASYQAIAALDQPRTDAEITALIAAERGQHGAG